MDNTKKFRKYSNQLVFKWYNNNGKNEKIAASGFWSHESCSNVGSTTLILIMSITIRAHLISQALTVSRLLHRL